MEPQETIFKSGIKNPQTFNYAVICTAFNLDADPKILLVDYKEKSHHTTQAKLPAGRFQARDLISAIEMFLVADGNRHPELEFLIIEIENLNRTYMSTVTMYEQTAESEKRDVNHSQLNILFNDFTARLLTLFQKSSSSISEVQFAGIFEQCYLNTVINELKEETNAHEIEGLYISDVSSNHEVHYKIGFVSTSVKAPALYAGGPDRKIERSYWDNVDESPTSKVNQLFNGHKNNFQAGIRVAIELNLHPNAKNLEKFLTASK